MPVGIGREEAGEMAKNSQGKERILALERIITNKPQPMSVLLRRLQNEYGVTAERKTIYSDIATLTFFVTVTYEHGKGYFLVEV